MKKIIIKLIIIIIVISLCGCKNKQIDIKNISSYDNNIININYPIFHINKLDKKINEEVKKIKNNFENTCHGPLCELNIDFKYKILNNDYINFMLITSVYNKKEINNITTILYNKKTGKLASIKEIIKNNNQLNNILSKEFKNKYGESIINKIDIECFFIDNNYINFYINDSRTYIVNIPLNSISFNIKFTENSKSKTINDSSINKNIDLNKPMIALTFDDGPSVYTNEILNILKENNAYATFFILGNKVTPYKDTIIKAIQNGNEIGNHTYNHKWLARLNDTQIKEQIIMTQKIMFEQTGYVPKLLRPSYGSVNKKVRNDTNLEIVLWTVDTLDWKIKNTKGIVKRATKNVKNGDIVLMHDTYKKTKDAIPIIIKELKEKGFQFVTVSDLKEINKMRTNNGL